MKKRWKKNNCIYLLWSILLLVFLGIMGERYCRMMYGGGIVYVLSGQNEITEAERQYLREKGALVYAEMRDSFPAQLYDKTLQEENGFATDLMDQLALEMETSIEFLPIEWPEVFDTLESGGADIIQISYSQEREEQYYLTEPLYNSKGVVFLRRKGQEAEKLSDLKGKRIAGISKDYAMEILKEKMPELDIQEYNSIDACAKMLKAGKVDGIVTDEQNIMYYAQEQNMMQDYYVMDEEVYSEGVVFAVRKTDEKLGQIINKAVYKIRNGNLLDKLQQKWFLQSVHTPIVTDRDVYLWMIQTALGILGFMVFLFWHIHAGTEALVVERTRELEQERKRLKVILQSVPQYLVEISPDQTMKLVNREEEKEAPRLDMTPFQNMDWQKLLEESREKGYVQKEIPIDSKWYRITIGGMEDEKENGNALMVLEDITLHRMQERQNIQDNKMAAIGQLASGISHELKNPLEIICNYCYALKKGLFHTQEQIQETVSVIENEAKGANKIVDNLLSFARIAPDKVERTEVKPLIEMILELQRNLMKKKKVKAELVCEEGIYIKCNPEGMKRIFINLIRNAQEAMPAGGNIWITVRRVEQMVQIEIQDNGIGISEEVQEQIFNPFFTTKYAGTGLGLYLVYHQVRESGGTIEVSSVEGEGTTFRIYFPGVDEGRLE